MITTVSAPEWDPDQLDSEGVESVLRGALERIRFGWHQGFPFADLDGQETTADAASAYCLEGAIDAETAARGLDFRVAARAKKQVARAAGYHFGDVAVVAAFNDAPGRAKDEVIAVLRRALEALESERRHARAPPWLDRPVLRATRRVWR